MNRKLTTGLWAVMAVASVVGFSTAARADSIFLVSMGTESGLSGATVSATETVTTQEGGYGPLTSLTYSFPNLAVGGTFSGTGDYSNTVTGDLLDFSFSIPSSDRTLTSPGIAASGTLTFTGGTGDYAGASGAGTFAINYLTDTSASATISAASISVPGTSPSAAVPLPKPAVASALLLGLLAPSEWLRRRVAAR